MRGRYEDITALGANVVAIGTGGVRHARAFVEDEEVPYPVLCDDQARAARVASIERVNPLRLFHPSSYAGTARAWRSGHRIGMSGKRVDQLGATFVVGSGSVLHYEHRDAHSADHAPLGEVFEALRV